MKKGKRVKLIEVVVVVAVLAALPGLLWCSMLRARESARRAACLNNLKQIITGIKTYTPDYDEYYPTSAEPGKEINVETHYRDLGILYPTYMTSLSVFTCPSSGDRILLRGDETGKHDNNPFLDREAEQVSYAYSYDGGGEKNVVWREAATSTTRVLADRPAAKELTEQSNHGVDGRNVAFADGHVRWISGNQRLLTDPDFPDPKTNTQSWWSERPDVPRERPKEDPQVRHFRRMASLYPDNSFYSYAAAQMAKRQGDERAMRELQARQQERGWRRQPDREADLYSMTTGLLSIQESLQLDVMLEGKAEVEERTVPVSDLVPPKTRSLPFKEMLGGKEPQMSPLAAMVPEDQYYISFRSVSQCQSFMDFVDAWGEHCLKHYSLRANKAMNREKLERQLCVKDLWYARPITSLAVGEVSLTGSHPFVAQGDDLSLIMQVKIRAVFDPAIAKFVEQAKKSRPDAAEARFKVGQHEVYSLVTEDREISHYRADLDKYTVISNSKEAIRRILETADGDRASLAKTEDFRYMRSIFKHDDESESGFIYLSESFIRRQIGPQAKIAQARRLQCGTTLKMISNAAILFKHLEARFPKSLEEMIKNRSIEAQYLVCPDGGQYSWDADCITPVCSVHNRLRYLTPIVELKTDLASEREKANYQQFVERYNRYWRRYFDPVGIRITMAPSGLSLETMILPLVENSIYNGLTELAGGMPVDLAPRCLLPDTILSIQGQFPHRHVVELFTQMWDHIERDKVLTEEEEAARENAETDLKRAFGNVLPGVVKDVSGALSTLGLSELAEELSREVDVEELEETAESVMPIRVRGSLNFCDDPMLFGIQAGELGGMGVGQMGDFGFVAGAAALVLNFPVYGCFGVADPAAAERVLSYTAGVLAYQPSQEGWGEPRVTLYELEEYRGRKMRVIEAAIGPIRLRGFIAIVGYEAYLTPRLSLLKRIIDLAEEPAATPQPDALKANVALLIRPTAWDKVKSDFQLAWAASAREACLSNFDELQVLFKYFADMGIPIEKIAEKADGTRYFCPEGGEYQYDSAKNVVKCTIHGTIESPRQPEKMGEESTFSRLINGIDQIAVSLAFEGQGVRTRVNMTFKDNYSPFGP
ncbi:MAG: DUF1559 domain-containing protein [bacterium]|nr:DUF1559 domain-containing protein [bacterium]